jgi:hypothetical protein
LVETPPALILVGGLATFTSLEDNTLPTGTALLLVVIDSDDRGARHADGFEAWDPRGGVCRCLCVDRLQRRT